MNNTNLLKIYFFIFAFSCSINLQAQLKNIKGRVIEVENKVIKVIPEATIAIFSRDSTQITGVTSNTSGYFNIKDLKNGDYRIKISFIGYNPVNFSMNTNDSKKEIDLGDIQLKANSLFLNEVTVTASNIIRKMDRKIIFPSQNQIRKSSDGMELLRNLHLNGIDVSRFDNSISGARGGTVITQINGARATTKEVMAINPKDIIRVEYLDEPSLRYDGAEAVINYIVKKKESGGAVMASANNSLTTQWGEDFLNLKLNHKKSEFQLMYEHDYKKSPSHQDMSELFRFDNKKTLTRIEDGNWGMYRFKADDFKATYSLLEPDKYLFLATASMNNSSTPDNNVQSKLYQKGDESNAVLKSDISDSKSQMPTVNLYYQHSLKHEQLLVFDVTGTYIKTSQQRNYSETKANNKLTDIYSDVDGDKYSVIGEGAYENMFKAGRLSIGVKQIFNYANNRYQGDVEAKTKMKQQYTNFYAEWFGRIKEKTTYSIGMGGMYSHMKQGSMKYGKFLFTPTLRFGYQFNDRTELRYQGKVIEQSPSLGDMNNVVQAIDSLQIRRGNPELLPYTSYVNSITFLSSIKKIQYYIDLSDHYSIDPIMETVYLSQNKFTRMMENQKRWHNILATANVAYSTDWLYIYAKGGLNWINSKGNNYNHILRHWFIKSGFELTWKKWSGYAEISNGRKNLVGESASKRDNAIYTGIGYKIKNLSLNAIAFFSLNKWVNYDENINQYVSSERYIYQKNRNMVTLKAIWSFEFGRKYKNKNKLINNSDKDAGILNAR